MASPVPPCSNPIDNESTGTVEKADTSSACTDVQVTELKMKTPINGGKGGLFQHGAVLPTAICLSKAALGAGMLTIASHAGEVGIIFSIAVLMIAAVLTIISIRMIAQASIATTAWSFEDICEVLFHPALSFFTGFMNVCNCLGSAAAYLIVCGNIFSALTGASDAWRKLFVVLVGVFVCGPLSIARHVSFMRHLAALSVFALLFLVVVIAVYLGEHGPHESVTPQSLLLGPGGATAMVYMNTVNGIVFAYNNQFNVPQLTGELAPRPRVSAMTRVSLITMTLCFTLYAATSIIGVLAFGVDKDQKDSLIEDLAPDAQQPLVIVAFIAVMFSVLTCFQFHIYPIRQFAAYTIRKLRSRDAGDEKSDVVYCSVSLTRWFDIISALSSVVVVIFVAVVVTNVKVVLDFIGGFAGAYISFVVPALWLIQVRRRQANFAWIKPEVVLCLGMLALGVFLFIFGTYSAIRG